MIHTHGGMRHAAARARLSLVEAMVRAIHSRFRHEGIWCTLLAVCPNSEAVLKAALLAARDNRAPILFAATLNQVDTDGGYTGWRQSDFVQLVQKASQEITFEGTAVCALDHGGPWLKDRQRLEGYTFEQAMAGVRDSLAACLDAGYELLHIDTTVDIRLGPDERIDIHDVTMRTLELIDYAERYRRSRGLAAIGYEVGTEEVHGGLANIDNFRAFLDDLKAGLTSKGLADVWPTFIVGKVGTDLHTTEFDRDVASELARLAERYDLVIKGHYTDGVSNPKAYPMAHMGGANVGPEFTEVEYETLISLQRKEMATKHDASQIEAVLEQAVERSGRWKKWLLPDEMHKSFAELSAERKGWLTRTGCRYIWTNAEVRKARLKLARNLAVKGIDAEHVVIENIARRISKYFQVFNLVGAEAFLAEELNQAYGLSQKNR